jgi:hypothetical protein
VETETLAMIRAAALKTSGSQTFIPLGNGFAFRGIPISLLFFQKPILQNSECFKQFHLGDK